MEEALKWILVVCFGYLGFRNARFGRIECHQSVCAYAREFLLNAMEIVESHGFSAVHGIVDSLWIQAPQHISDEEFNSHCIQIAEEISAKTRIPLGYDPTGDRYECICFLPTKADPVIGALNRYWGKKINGSFKVRGVELRRHDSPAFIKQFQEEVMNAIGQSPYRKNADRLMHSTIIPVLVKYYDYLESGKATPEELAINIHVTRHFNEYKVQNYQAIAAAYLERSGAGVSPGQGVSFIITNDKAENPQERVLPLALYEYTNRSYDVGKYKELLVRAVTNLLPFEVPQSVKKKLTVFSVQEYRNHPRVQRSLSSYMA
jgi:DNA polymerase elongation subunit (family B)